MVLTRIDGKYIVKEFSKVLNFERGILYTIKELIYRPGINIRKFIQEDRNRLVKPVIFLLLCSLIYTFAQQLFQFEDGYVTVSGDTIITSLFEWIKSNYGYANIFMGTFIGLWIKILFRKSGYNIYEILILIFFVMGISMLIYTCFGIIESITKFNILEIGAIIGVIYASWAIASFFNKHKVSSYIKGFLSYFLGYITTLIIIIAIGFLIDTITN